jgi:hypothetical protein
MFGIFAEPLSVLAAGFLVRGAWKPVAAIYAVIFSAYFASPLGRGLPVWPLADALIALCLIYPAAKLSKNLFSENVRLLPLSLAIVSFITVATDGLARVFLLVPAGLYSLFFATQDAVFSAFVSGGVESFIEDVLVIIVSIVVGIPIVLSLRKVMNLREPIS